MNNKIDLKVVNHTIILYISLVKFNEYVLILIYAFYLFIFL